MPFPELHDTVQRDYAHLRSIADDYLPQPRYCSIKTWQDADYLIEIRHTTDQDRREVIGYKDSVGHILHLHQVKHDDDGEWLNFDVELVEKREHAPTPALDDDLWSFAYYSDS